MSITSGACFLYAFVLHSFYKKVDLSRNTKYRRMSFYLIVGFVQDKVITQY